LFELNVGESKGKRTGPGSRGGKGKRGKESLREKDSKEGSDFCRESVWGEGRGS